MKFKEAKEKLKELAGGKYHSISYEETVFDDGHTTVKCAIYVGDENRFFQGDTWEATFSARERGIPSYFTDEGQPD